MYRSFFFFLGLQSASTTVVVKYPSFILYSGKPPQTHPLAQLSLSECTLAPNCTEGKRSLLHPSSSDVCWITPTEAEVVNAQLPSQPEHFPVLFSWSQQDLWSREAVISFSVLPDGAGNKRQLFRLIPFITSADSSSALRKRVTLFSPELYQLI